MIQLHTFGAVNLRRDSTDVRSVLSQPRRLALLVYLATARPRGFHSRDRILGMFWPDSDDARGRNALRQALHQLRRSLGENVIVNRGENEIGTNPDRLSCDAAAFDDAVSAGRFEAALELYRGDFLAGFFLDESPAIERFIEDERLRFRRAAVGAAWSLAEAEETRGRPEAAAAWSRRALSIDPLDESSVRRAMQLLDRAGERAAALLVYSDFTRRIEAELELEPAPETVRLADRLKATSAVPTADASPAPEPVAPAQVVVSHAPIPTVPAEPAPLTRLSGGRWVRKATPAFVAVALLILSVQVVASRRARSLKSAPPATSAEAAIAVLPFLNMSGDAANDYFADGMTEELTYALSRVPGLRVVGHTSAFSFKGKDVALDSIGRALRVPYLLEGSVRTTGQRVRIVAQMIDAASGYHVWSNTWDGDLHDVFDFQAEIARAVVLELEPRLVAAGDPVSVTPATLETDDPAAYADVLRGYQALFAGELEDYFRAPMRASPPSTSPTRSAVGPRGPVRGREPSTPRRPPCGSTHRCPLPTRSWPGSNSTAAGTSRRPTGTHGAPSS